MNTSQDIYNYAAINDINNLIIALNNDNNNEWYIHHVHNNVYLNGSTPIHIAAYNGYIDAINLLLENDADIESRTTDEGYTSLMLATQRNMVDCIHFLIDRGCNIESITNKGAAAIHIAAFEGNFASIEALLDRGANIDRMNRERNTALFIVSFQGRLDILHFLIERGADLEISADVFIPHLGIRRVTALFMAAYLQKVDICRLLLDKGAAINQDNIDIIINTECQEMVLNEIENRTKRAEFDSFIVHYLEYHPYKDKIYTRCFPTGDLRIATPPIGWLKAYSLRDKYYFDEILFYVHLYVANEQSKKFPNNNDNIKSYLSNNNNVTYTLMKILSDRLKMYLKPL
jgi:ankyrin repeat protein